MAKKTMGCVVVCALLLSACAGRAVPPSAAGTRSFDGTLKQGLDLMFKGEYGKAADELRTALAIQPDSYRAHNFLGLCYMHQKEYDRARAEFEKTVALKPTFAKAHNNLAGVYSIKSQYGKAEESYKKALEIEPDMVAALYSLGLLLTNLGRTDEGAGYLARGIALEPNYLDENKGVIMTFSSVAFNMKEAYFACAKAYAAAGNLEKTVEYLNKARASGFKDWGRILTETEFQKLRAEPKIQAFLKREE